MNEKLTVGSLFSGIGGFDLGFERAGMRTVWFCEQDPFCQRVLAKHWPGVPCYPDVCALVADSGSAGRRQDLRGAHGDEGTDEGRATSPANLANGGGEGAGEGPVVPVSVPYVDVLCGGFPCQDISLAGKGEGIDGSRSGLWREFARLIGELRPRYVVIENVPALLSRGGDRVLADLAACGFDAEWDCLPAAAFGAPHRRDRFWLVAYPEREGLEGFGSFPGSKEVTELGDGGCPYCAPDEPCALCLAQPVRPRRLGAQGDPPGAAEGRGTPGGLDRSSGWATEPNVGRVVARIPDRVDRLRALGNSLVPQIAEWIGRRILEAEEELRAAA